ncbi:MAG: Hsp20/alpha crystallin family protein [Candidatus Kariarchaeaceae archaeon]
MISDEREGFEIQNGKLVNEGYSHDFHLFETEIGGRIEVILPGILHESLQVRSSDNSVEISGRVDKRYLQLYKARLIRIAGTLPFTPIPGVLTSTYDKGILSIELVSADRE